MSPARRARRSALLIAAGASLLAAPAMAQSSAKAGPAIMVEDFVGTLTVVSGAPGIDIQRSAPDLRTSEGDTLLIDGGIKRPGREKVCDSYGGGFTLSINGRDRMGGDKKARKRLQDYPDITVSVPEGATMTVRNSVLRLDASDGPVLSAADIDLMGCFDASLGDVLDLRVDKSGSGGLSAGAVGTVSLDASGSGNIEIEEAGLASVNKSGSGEIRFGRVGRGLDISKSGSGNTEIGEMYGAFSLNQSGAGDVDIGGGEITTLTVRKSGSGNVEVDASVGDADLRSSGSGDIEIDRVSGRLKQTINGSGNVRVGDR